MYMVFNYALVTNGKLVKSIIPQQELFKSRPNMIEERSLGVKAPGGSKVEHPCRGTKREGVAKYATKHNNFNFVETKVLKL